MWQPRLHAQAVSYSLATMDDMAECPRTVIWDSSRLLNHLFFCQVGNRLLHELQRTVEGIDELLDHLAVFYHLREA
jgi:hypothetical protein